MKNYYLNYKAQILAIAKRNDVDGCANGKPSLTVACDIFDTNARVATTGVGTFVECGVPKSNKDFWSKARNDRNAVSSLADIHKMQVEFANSCRK